MVANLEIEELGGTIARIDALYRRFLASIMRPRPSCLGTLLGFGVVRDFYDPSTF